MGQTYVEKMDCVNCDSEIIEGAFFMYGDTPYFYCNAKHMVNDGNYKSSPFVRSNKYLLLKKKKGE